MTPNKSSSSSYERKPVWIHYKKYGRLGLLAKYKRAAKQLLGGSLDQVPYGWLKPKTPWTELPVM